MVRKYGEEFYALLDKIGKKWKEKEDSISYTLSASRCFFAIISALLMCGLYCEPDPPSLSVTGWSNREETGGRRDDAKGGKARHRSLSTFSQASKARTEQTTANNVV